MTGEDFYRIKYPKVLELTVMDKEIIALLDEYVGKLTTFNSDYAKLKDALECIAEAGGCLTGEDAREMKQIAIEALQ
jgi:hypothetical protein